MLKQLQTWLASLQWLDSEHDLSSWVELGINHGFEGLAYQLPASTYSLQQIHGRDIIEVSAAMDPNAHYLADGLWTSQKNVRIAIKTADCVPILIYHPRMVMALHAGWKGLALDIIGEALQVLSRQNIEAKECRVGIGPAISSDSFEVGPEVLAQFQNNAYALDDVRLTLAARKGIEDRWHLDLSILAALRFQSAGWKAEQISVLRTCTKLRPLLWHSYRRDGARAGRNWSWIML